jgi:hypothetical protein
VVVLPVGPLALLAAVDQGLTSEAEIFFFFSVVLVDVTAEDIYWEEGGGGGRERERERERESSTDR